MDLIVATDSEGILGIGDWGSAASRSRPASWRSAGLCEAAAPGVPLLPPVTSLRAVSAAVAEAVARAAQAEGLARTRMDDPAQQVTQAMWEPVYPVIEPGRNTAGSIPQPGGI